MTRLHVILPEKITKGTQGVKKEIQQGHLKRWLPKSHVEKRVQIHEKFLPLSSIEQNEVGPLMLGTMSPRSKN